MDGPSPGWRGCPNPVRGSLTDRGRRPSVGRRGPCQRSGVQYLALPNASQSSVRWSKAGLGVERAGDGYNGPTQKMDPLDHSVRMAAFRFLEEQTHLVGEDGALRRSLLERGFTYDGQRVPLLGPQGIFKPRVLRSIPLSITSVPVVEGEKRPYDDAFGADGLLRYRYRGTDPAHHENVGLRQAMQQQVPLIYFHGIVPGLYA